MPPANEAARNIIETTREFVERLVRWTKLKIRIQVKKDGVKYAREREIWWAHLGVNIGNEQDGKNELFERPVLIVKNLFSGRVFWALPVTSKEHKDGNYFFKNTYEQLDGQKITQYVILPQLRALSFKRLIRKIRVMPMEEFEVVIARLKDLLSFEE